MRTWLILLVLFPAGLAGCRQPMPWQGGGLAANGTGPGWFNFNPLARNNSGMGGNSPWSFGNRTADSSGGIGSWSGSLFRRNNQMAGNDPQQNQMFQGLSEQVQNLSQRLGHFDNDNQQLLTDLAATKQKLQASNDYNYQLKQQLTDSVAQMQQLQNSKASLEQQLAAAQFRTGGGGMLPASTSGGVPSQLASAATLRANNSLMQKISLLQLPGVTTRMDGDVIRVELPSDQLFEPNSYRINANYGQVLQQLAASITRNFPEQVVGVEAHWDNTPLQNATAHQFTATQSLAVFDYLQKLGLPGSQLFTMAVGSNRPRYPTSASAGTNSNRRVEVVIYPETYTGR
jgi:flagellar motor protein MotB